MCSPVLIILALAEELNNDVKLSRGPVVISVPATLVDQWIGQLKGWVVTGAVDIFKYAGSFRNDTRQTFWRAYEQSSQPSFRRIIVCSHTVRH